MFIKIVGLALLIYLAYRLVVAVRQMRTAGAPAYRTAGPPPRGEDLVQDPFCKTYVPKSQAYIREIDGQSTFFAAGNAVSGTWRQKNKSQQFKERNYEIFYRYGKHRGN